jgi:ABC-type polysaccharide/polyol phosphate transport system ATPase subunit
MAKITVTDVSLTFRIRPFKRITLKEYLLRLWRTQRTENPAVQIHALSGVSVSAGDGERVGVIGHNGAGKSTLLRTLAGIYPPTTGTVEVQGKISSLFDITLGFEPEANGWDNILYRAFLQGETPRTLRQEQVRAIAEFSELGDFLRIPVRSYSAGMLMRLAFAISTAIDPEVLLVDEVLGVGDLAFQRKAKARVEEMMQSARLMVMVSHDLNAIKTMCSRAIWLQHGTVVMDGKPEEVVKAYQESVSPPASPPTPPGPHVGGLTAAA